MAGIFWIGCERQDILERFSLSMPQRQEHSYAWELMKKHVHVLPRSGVSKISSRFIVSGNHQWLNQTG